MTLRRKKWTEEEERSLIDKYAEMQSDGVLARMRTREKKFRPIASHVNAGHHTVDPAAYPFLWSWKDASTKVQNMRHQYLLVKQKLLSSIDAGSVAEPDWSQGLALWPNFLRYRHVFGDSPLPPRTPFLPSSAAAPEHVASGDGDLGLELGFDCSDEDGEFNYDEPHPPPLLPPPPPPSLLERRKKKRRIRLDGRDWARVSAALAELREREERLEGREQEEEGRRMAREAEDGLRRRRREDEEREWEDRMERRRSEWRKRMEATMEQHRAEMARIQASVLHKQQTVVNQLAGIISHLAAGGSGSTMEDIAEMGAGGDGDNLVDHFIVEK